jgi:hypothetical protein
MIIWELIKLHEEEPVSLKETGSSYDEELDNTELDELLPI